MSDQNLHHISMVLSQYMCKHIIGSKETVKTKRILMTLSDNMAFDDKFAKITSGSFGEGLEMKGSDFDFMCVSKDLQVYENRADIQRNPLKTYFTVESEDCKPGFVKLLLSDIPDITYVNLCVEYRGSFYLSNILIKDFFKLKMSSETMCDYATEVNHGPCLSDKEGMLDNAICLQLRSWISQADRWLTRPNSSWPCDDIKSSIIEHGCLFVPIGVKGSRNEEIEWRISFSVGEKLLINSFTHSQLLCYALMKIILKDIINTDNKCKDLLCSYFIKNIIFWVSEELPFSIWKTHNLISCFMRCFRRLIYCVQYSICPHYFIQENNMFENKIEGHSRRVLLDRLNELYDNDWQFILFSPQLQDFLGTPCIRYTESQLFISYFEQINLSTIQSESPQPLPDNYDRSIKMLSAHRSSIFNSCSQYNLSKLCGSIADTISFTDRDYNRQMYKKYKICQSYLLQNLHHDAVSGWLHVASLFYRIKQYKIALDILSYALSKCSQEKVSGGSKLSRAQGEILKSKTLQSRRLVGTFKFLRLENVFFNRHSTLIPRELELEVFRSRCSIPSVVYANFLSCLCHFHLRDTRQFRNSLEDLQLTITEEYFISNYNFKSISYNCLGVILQLVGDQALARQAFHNAIRLDPDGILSCAKRRLSMIDSD